MGKSDPAPAKDDMNEASINALAAEILKVIADEPLYYSAVAERFSGHTFQAVARALGQLHVDEKLWQDPRGRLCVRGSTFAVKVPGKN
jgi:2,5-furandicarboxylate decarboxylase 1